ncbi:CDC27 family protein [Sulfurovum sp. NBC37-1]|uniref:CDC27 family protein n=1 Tax=Sulfurovum sp. (strain NBC37-1) TaxID=387093 RepID=UPI0001587D5F|nr:CDC27 family protein [Sulfurovum sp. NBC37-1]BAF72623.1 conserved hypothetical protein [Sulfurovum sp. NBC37-1]
MYDIKPLEEEWEKYRRKKRKPFLIIVFTLLLMGIAAGLLYYMKDRGFIGIDMNITKKAGVDKSLVFIENKPLNRLEIEQPLQSIQIQPEEASDEIVEDLPLSSEKTIRKKPRLKMNIVTTEMPTIKKSILQEKKPHKRAYLTITKISGSSAFKEVAKRFRETQDTDDSLFLAKAYYNQGQYKKAEYWALQTNNVNSGIEESILIFAKAKVKLGRKNEAIRVLSKYIKQTDSAKAKVLLEKIKKGKL